MPIFIGQQFSCIFNLLGSTSEEARNPVKYTGWDVKPRKLRNQYTMIDNIESLAKINIINKHRTYELLSRSLVTWCMKKVKAQVVLSVGLNANWSAITVESIAGKSQFLTTNFSVRRDRIWVTEMGLFAGNSV